MAGRGTVGQEARESFFPEIEIYTGSPGDLCYLGSYCLAGSKA